MSTFSIHMIMPITQKDRIQSKREKWHKKIKRCQHRQITSTDFQTTNPNPITIKRSSKLPSSKMACQHYHLHDNANHKARFNSKAKKQVTEEGSRRTILQVHYREREREDKLLEKCYNTFVIACAATLAGDCSIDPHLCMQLLATLAA